MIRKLFSASVARRVAAAAVAMLALALPVRGEAPDTALPRDAATDAWYIPLPPGGGTDSPDAAVGGFAVPGEGKAVVTGLPVLEIATESGELPGDEDEPGTLRLFEADGAGGVRVLETPIEINLRGNTSRRFPKKSWRVRLVDSEGEKRKLSLCGLRADDDWILNPMYSDSSKIREALGYWLWEQINACGQAAASSRVRYAEVLLNGEYHGLYGVQERVDRKQVGADKGTGILYKVTANDRPTAQELLACDSDGACRGIELAFAGANVDAPWAPAADYMAFLDGGEPPGNSRLSQQNAVDYALWSMLVQARDGHFKNMFIHCVAKPEGGWTLYRIPWDLNHTLGDLWAGDSPETNFVEYEIGDFALDDAAVRLLEAGDGAFEERLRARWAELRAGAITEENLLSFARELFDRLYPAILRDTARWPECGMGEGSAANIRDIEDYVKAVLMRMDRQLQYVMPAETER